MPNFWGVLQLGRVEGLVRVSVVLGVLYTVLKALVYGRFGRFECRVEGETRNYFLSMWRPEEKNGYIDTTYGKKLYLCSVN